MVNKYLLTKKKIFAHKFTNIYFAKVEIQKTIKNDYFPVYIIEKDEKCIVALYNSCKYNEYTKTIEGKDFVGYVRSC